MKNKPEPYQCKQCKALSMHTFISTEHCCIVEYCGNCFNIRKVEDL
jgi:hypothetical protein